MQTWSLRCACTTFTAMPTPRPKQGRVSISGGLGRTQVVFPQLPGSFSMQQVEAQ